MIAGRMSGQAAGPSKFASSTGRIDEIDVDLLFVPVFQDELDLRDLPGVDEATGGDIARGIAAGAFRGKLYQSLTSRLTGGWKARAVSLVGIGRRRLLDVERMRRAA